MTDLSPVMQRFILHWGEMGTRWGINRTVAQIHALLYVSERPLAADEIVEALGVARSNVSTSLRELQGWGIVRVVHVMDDRRDHFESMRDVWEMFETILDERKRREIDPTVKLLRECVAELDRERGAKKRNAHIRERLATMLDFMESMTRWYGQLRSMPRGVVVKLVKMGSRVGRLIGVKAG